MTDGSHDEERELLRETVAALVDKHARPGGGARGDGVRARLRRVAVDSCCASRSASPRWWCPRNSAAPAANSPTPPSCSRSSARRWCRPRCWAPPWPSSRCWPPTNPTPTRSSSWPRAASIGAVVFDPDYVVNGDVADVVDRRRRQAADPLDRVHRAPRRHDGPDPPAGPRRAEGHRRRSAPTPGLADTAAILLAAEQIGAATQCLDLTVDYTKDRVQFGRPIGSFQALKHRMADLYVAVQSARAVVDDAIAEPVADVGRAGPGRGQRGVLEGGRRSRPDARRHRDHLGARHPAVLQARARQRAAARARRGSTCVGSNPRCSNPGISA